MYSADVIRTFVALSLKETLSPEEESWMSERKDLQEILDPLLATCHAEGKADALEGMADYLEHEMGRIEAESTPDPQLHILKDETP